MNIEDEICGECGHLRDGHKDQFGGICIGCPCAGFKPTGEFWDGVPDSHQQKPS